MENKFILSDCLDLKTGITSYPDNYFDLAIVDPPYGIGEGDKKNKTRSSYTGFAGKRSWVNAKDYGGGEYDKSIPGADYFYHLFRVSKNQIIWGANYMTHFLPPSMGWIVWDKDNGACDQSDCELAFTSFKKGLRKAKFRWQGLLQQDMKNKEIRIHPNQKPVALYQWILSEYAKPGDLILDTHAGSASSLIACESMGFNYVGYEIDPQYYAAAKKRISTGIQSVIW